MLSIKNIIVNIKLVPFEDGSKPVVYNNKVYQLCFQDSDGDCILKDNINGVKILHEIFSGDIMYDEHLIEVLNDHPFNKVMQIEGYDGIMDGSTAKLQALIDLYYNK